jgi:hypothetical protein
MRTLNGPTLLDWGSRWLLPFASLLLLGQTTLLELLLLTGFYVLYRQGREGLAGAVLARAAVRPVRTALRRAEPDWLPRWLSPPALIATGLLMGAVTLTPFARAVHPMVWLMVALLGIVAVSLTNRRREPSAAIA